MARRKKDVSRRRASRTTPAGETPGDAAEQVPLSDAQELPYFKRREGREWAPVEVDSGVRILRDTIADADKDAGLRIWRIGDRGFELYNGFPERVKNFRSFRVFLIDALAESTLSIKDMEEALRIRAGVPDPDLAAKYGRKKLSLGIQLLDLLGVTTFEALTERDLPQSDGSTCRFPATVRKLRDALTILQQDPATTAVSRKLLGRAARLNEALAAAKKEDPALKKFSGKYVARDGDVFLESPPLSTAQRCALARLILKLEGDEE